MAAFFTFITAAATIVVMYYFWTQIMAALDNLKREVQEQGTVIASAMSLIALLKRKIDEALAGGNAEESLQALADELDARQQELAQAVAANTPAEGETPDQPGTGDGTTPTDPTQPGQPEDPNRPI